MFPTFDNIPTPMSNNTIKNTDSLSDLKKTDKTDKSEKTEKSKVTNPYVNKYMPKKSNPLSKEKKPLK